jgi:1-acyl-sn-glycerol-3-phosphate acyltransferase
VQKAFYRTIIRPLTVKAATRLFVESVSGAENIPKDGAAILVANHASYLDFILIPSIISEKTGRSTCILAAEELTKHPVIGVFARNDNCILLNRNKLGNVMEVDFFKKGLKALRDGDLLLIFPEGTRSLDGSVRPWKVGFLKLALAAKVPVIPVALDGTFSILPKGKNFPRLGRKCRVFFERPVSLDQYFGNKPTKEQLEEISEAIKKKIIKRVSR